MSDSYADRLKAVNDLINTTNIKGKEYAEVNQRILAFWELFPEGRIVTEKLADTGNRCDFKAEIYADRDSENPIATGYTFEDRQGMINKTSYVENAETSAVGRALGMLGIGAMNALASADEVRGAISQQEPKAKQVPKNDAKGRLIGIVQDLKGKAKEAGADIESVNAWYVERYEGRGLDKLNIGELEELQTHLLEAIKAQQ